MNLLLIVIMCITGVLMVLWVCLVVGMVKDCEKLVRFAGVSAIVVAVLLSAFILVRLGAELAMKGAIS